MRSVIAKQIYRGFDLLKQDDGQWRVEDGGLVHGIYPSEGSAMNAVDQLKRAQRLATHA